MNEKEFFKKWVEALRSGKYKQTTNGLYDDYAKHMLQQKEISLETINNYASLYEENMYNNIGE